MNSKTYLFSVSLCLFSSIAHADDAPFKVSVSPEYGRNSTYFWQYKIISKENDLIIQSLEVNRGKCDVNEEFRRAYEKRKDLHERSESILDSAYGKGRRKNAFTEKMPEYYKKLNFSEAFLFSVTTNAKFSYCEPMELTVGTNQGDYTVSWDN